MNIAASIIVSLPSNHYLRQAGELAVTRTGVPYPYALEAGVRIHSTCANLPQNAPAVAREWRELLQRWCLPT